jgi:hypothetical protein
MNDLHKLRSAVDELVASYGRLRAIAETMQTTDARDILESALQDHDRLTCELSSELEGTGLGLLDGLMTGQEV